jgi:hypothetical protein
MKIVEMFQSPDERGRFSQKKTLCSPPNMKGKQSADGKLQLSSPLPLTRRKSVHTQKQAGLLARGSSLIFSFPLPCGQWMAGAVKKSSSLTVAGPRWHFTKLPF